MSRSDVVYLVNKTQNLLVHGFAWYQINLYAKVNKILDSVGGYK